MLKTLVSCLITATFLQGSLAIAAGDSEFILFVSANDLELFSVDDPVLQMSDFTPAVDALYSYNTDRWRILGEYYATDDEAELERLQFGYKYAADSTLWAGRFHQPISAWNHRYHHGAFLQPSIARPAIENWEDESGVVPAHVTGVMVDAWQPLRGSSGIRYTASFGLAPRLVRGELRPFDVLNLSNQAHEPAGSFDVSYFPDIVGETSIGLIGGYAEIRGDSHPQMGIVSSFDIRQLLVGGQINWQSDQWQAISAVYYIDNEPSQTAANFGGHFTAGYAQVSGSLSQRFGAYARIERTSNADDAGYLRFYPLFVHHKEMIGMRFDFRDRQAVNFEISDNEIATDSYFEARIQWSAAFP